MYIDVHSHILPNVDDGSKSEKDSVAMLRALKAQGVGAVVLSPHFYPTAETGIGEYRKRIDTAFKEFTKKNSKGLPEMFLGCEAHFFNGMSMFSELEKLCIGNSRHILIELPYRPISIKTVNEITDICLSRHLIPILAHIERFAAFENYDKLLSLIDDGYALGQVNAYSFLQFSTRRLALKLLKRGYVFVIGSDCHSPDKNPPRIGEALDFIEKKVGRGCAEMIRENSDRLYREIRGDINEKAF